MVHGAIDGYSRLITCLQCSNNNKSSTVLALFQSGVEVYRVRIDGGGENVQVKNHRPIRACVLPL